ncbi:MAG TPA: glycoside hydrolase family 20 zincin-like fold domain-containing protein [Candidatus Paceibacterota bacterium]|nr:glycoside hydrolase family 20 zincin-like fold domain-containing protein [Verrucomicrobiota bacterium]HSA09630.1 glycoside hydrolase family 20 zincin-like fold domain-containing protein [Candidatus Paceibacterota bacterium]
MGLRRFTLHLGFGLACRLLVLFGPLFSILLATSAPAAIPALVPPVREWRESGERLVLRSPVRIEARDQFLAQVLAGEIQLHGARTAFGRGRGLRILLGRPEQPAVRRALVAAGLSAAVPEQAESYLISINPRGVVLSARDDAGLYYAVQTLRQLMRGEPGGIVLPGGVIRDRPELGFRGLSVDLGQGVVPTEAQMRRIVETCGEYKLNVVSFYLQHLVPFRATPLLAPKGAELDLATLRRLVEFAAQRHVTLMPQQQTFGHLHHLLKHELYAHLGEMPHASTLTAGDPAVYEWVECVADELTGVLPGPFFHAGGDETWDLGKGVNRDAVSAEGGFGKLWAGHMTRVADILRRHNRRTLFWGDRALKAPTIIPQLPRDMVAATWTYKADDKFAEFITPFRQAGLDVLVCPSVNNWSKPAPDFNVAVKNIGRFVAEGKKQGALGMLNTVWFDDGESLFDVVWYPVLYAAAASWQGADVAREQFDEAYDWAFHRAEGQAVAGAIRKLGEVHETARRAGLADAANEYLWLDPYSGRGARIHSRLAPQAAAMRRSAEEALTAIIESRRHCRLHTNALDYLEFAARRMDWLGMKAQFASEIANFYRDAREHPEETRRVNYAFLNMSVINGRVQDLRDMAGEMKEQYRQLWLAANRPYLLNAMLALYDRELLYWLDKADRLEEARVAYRQTHTLPEPVAIGLSEP